MNWIEMLAIIIRNKMVMKISGATPDSSGEVHPIVSAKNLIVNGHKPIVLENKSDAVGGSDQTSDTNRIWATADGSSMRHGDYFSSLGFTTETEIAFSSEVEIYKIDGSSPNLADFNGRLTVTPMRMKGGNWAEYGKLNFADLDGVNWKYRVAGHRKVSPSELVTGAGSNNMGIATGYFPVGYGVRVTDSVLVEGNIAVTGANSDSDFIRTFMGGSPDSKGDYAGDFLVRKDDANDFKVLPTVGGVSLATSTDIENLNKKIEEMNTKIN